VNLDELRPILAGYRAQVQQAWSPATAHEGYEGKAGDPAGQCGVTSAWLQRRLLEDHDIDTLFCKGGFYATPTDQGVDHCWLELSDGSCVVIDLTADQFGEESVVCDTYGELVIRDRVYYIARSGVPPEDLLADPVQSRLAALTEAVGS